MSDPKYLRPGIPFALAHVVEECGEALAAAGKCQRWGLDSVNPELPAVQQETNLAWLLRELDDLESAIHRLRAAIKDDPLASPLKQTIQAAYDGGGGSRCNSYACNNPYNQVGEPELYAAWQKGWEDTDAQLTGRKSGSMSGDISLAWMCASIALATTLGVKPLPSGLSNAIVGDWDVWLNNGTEPQTIPNQADPLPAFGITAFNQQYLAVAVFDPSGGSIANYDEDQFIGDMRAATPESERL